MSESKREILPMPTGGVGPDDIAIISCGMCGAMCSNLPLCDFCWSDPDEKHQRAVDRLMLAMPKNWPGRKLYMPRIAQARALTNAQNRARRA